MNLARLLREIARSETPPEDMDPAAAAELFGRMLDGGLPELELGAVLMALRMKTETAGELLGFGDALASRMQRIAVPAQGPRTVVIPSYGGALSQPNLLALLALLLRRAGVPVLIHGQLEGHGRVASAYVLRELGVMPSADAGQAGAALSSKGIAFVPLGVIAPGLAQLVALRGRIGVRTCAQAVAAMMDAAEGESLRLVPVSEGAHRARFGHALQVAGAHALLADATEGEAFANPRRRPRIEFHSGGAVQTLFEREHVGREDEATASLSPDARATAAYVQRAIDGQAPVPMPIVNQLAACLYASGYANDLNEAKAVAAVQARTHALA
jgi:anthranilate phosphoribosyltransferase